MIRFLLLLFSVVILALLAFKALDSNQFQWQCGALAAFVAAFLIEGFDRPTPWGRRPQ